MDVYQAISHGTRRPRMPATSINLGFDSVTGEISGYVAIAEELATL